jgi:uncharacterized membrane protein
VNEFAFARALHVLAVVVWIGGVAFVTTVALPSVRRHLPPAQRLAFFDRIERRFAWQARATTLLAGFTGFWMTHRFGLWPRFAQVDFWWMHAMVLVWALFTLMLFVLEPLVLHRWLETRNARDPEGTFALVQRVHWVLLVASLIAVLGATAGSHGSVLSLTQSISGTGQ